MSNSLCVYKKALFYFYIYKINTIALGEEVFRVLCSAVCITEVLSYVLYKGMEEKKILPACTA